MRLLLDTYFYSVLYYNAVVWLTPDLKLPLKQSLLSFSTQALRSSMNVDYDMSFENLHLQCKKCTTKQIMLYQITLKLHKVFIELDPFIRTETVCVFEQSVCSR